MSSPTANAFVPSGIPFSTAVGSKSTPTAPSFVVLESATSSADQEHKIQEGGNDEDGDDAVLQDAATTTAELLSSLWDMIAQGSSMVRGVSPFHAHVHDSKRWYQP